MSALTAVLLGLVAALIGLGLLAYAREPRLMLVGLALTVGGFALFIGGIGSLIEHWRKR